MKNVQLMRAVYSLVLLFGLAGVMRAQDHTLNIAVKDIQGKPISNVHLKVLGGQDAITDAHGRARLMLLPQIMPGQELLLDIKRPTQDFVFISPWDGRVVAPAFNNSSQAVVTVVLARRGERPLLKDSRALTAMATGISKRLAPRANSKQITYQERKEALAWVARIYGVSPSDLDQALRTWGQSSSDPYEQALAAFYGARYSEASDLLSSSLKVREDELENAKDKLAHVLLLEGQSFYELGKYREAISAFQRALDLIPNDATFLSRLGKALAKIGDYDQAAIYLKRGLEITQKTLGSEHPNCATILSSLAEVYAAQGKYTEAEDTYRQALAIRVKLDEHPAVATSYDDLGGTYYLQGKYVEALAFYRLALTIREKTLGSDHPDVATSLNNLASLDYIQGKYAEAEVMFERALAIRQKTLGSDHPDVATSLNNLANLYYIQGKYAEAEATFTRGLEIREKSLGPGHPAVGASLNDIGLLYSAQKRYAEAEVTFKRALAIGEKALGPDHPAVGDSLNNLGELYNLQGKYPEAEACFTRALAIREKALGPDHPDVAISLSNLANLYTNQGKYAEAEMLFRRGLAVLEKSLGRENISVAEVLDNYSLMLVKTGRGAEASVLKERAKQIRRNNSQSEPKR